MQERVRAVEFVLGHAGLAPMATTERQRVPETVRGSDPARVIDSNHASESPTPHFDALRAALGGSPRAI